MNRQRTVLKGQKYVAPKAEIIEIINQGVLCASASNLNASSITSFTNGGSL